MKRFLRIAIPTAIALALTVPAARSATQGAAYTVVESGRGYDQLQDAVNAIGSGTGTIRFASYRSADCAIQEAGSISYVAEVPGQAILDGAQQIAIPAFVATLAICIVFVSVVFLTGPAKYLFTPLAMAVVFASERPFDEAMAGWHAERDAHAMPIYEFTTQMATLEPPPPEMQQLLGAISANQPAMDAFVSITAGTLSPAEFFDPANLATLAGAATATT